MSEEKSEKKESLDEMISSILDSKRIIVHPSVDYSDQLGYTLGLSIARKNSKLILTCNHVFDVKFGVFNLVEGETNLGILKQVQPMAVNRNYLLDTLKVVRLKKSKRFSTEDLLKSIRLELIAGKVSHYWYHEDGRWHIAVACWAIGTFLHVLFVHYPILNLQGERESGKSTLQFLLSYLVRSPTGRTAVLREAPLFRTIESLRPTFFIDVQQVVSRPDLMDLCETCTEVGGSVPRCVGENHKVKYFEVYTPVCLATRVDIPFGSKAIRIITTKPPIELHREYTKRRNKIPRDSELSELRQSIMLCCFDYAKEVKAVYDTLEQTEKLYGRLFDYWRPLLAVCKVFFPNRYDELLSLAEDYALLYSPSDFMIEVENEVLRFALTIIGREPCGAYLKEITKTVDSKFPNLKISWQRVKSAMSNLGIVNRFYSKRGGMYVYFNKEKIEVKTLERFKEEAEVSNLNDVIERVVHEYVERHDQPLTEEELSEVISEVVPKNEVATYMKYLMAEILVKTPEGDWALYRRR